MSLIDHLESASGLSDAAFALQEYGFPVIPLGAKGETPPDWFVERHGGDMVKAWAGWPKAPRIAWKEYQRTAATGEQVEAWWNQWPSANIGIPTGPQVVVVDGDNPEAVSFIERELTATPFVVRTGKGFHYYYRANPDIRVTNSARRGLDVRGAGGYVVAPGSIHPDGTEYRLDWRGDDDFVSVRDLPMIDPADLAAVARFQKGVDAPAAGGDVLFNMADIRAPHDGSPVEEGGRNNAAASLAGQYIKAGQSLAEIAANLHEWNKSNPSPLPAAEVDSVVASVVRTHVENNPGETIPVAPPARPGFILTTARDWAKDNEPRPAPLWRDGVLFEGGRVMVAGPPKAGKSRFVLDLARALATGDSFLGEPCQRPARVAWVQAEIHKGFVGERINAMRPGLRPDQVEAFETNLTATGRLDLDLTSALDRKSVVDGLTPFEPDVVIFDPVINFSTANENDNIEVKRLLREVDRIGTTLGAAIILVHHSGKSQQGDIFDAGIRGAGAWRAWYDTGVVLRRDKAGATVVSYETRNVEAPPSHGLNFDEYGRAAIAALEGEDERPPVLSAEDISDGAALIHRAIPFGRANAVTRAELCQVLRRSDAWLRKDGRIKEIERVIDVKFETESRDEFSRVRVYWRE